MSWQKVNTSPYPLNFDPQYPATVDGTQVTEIFLDKNNKPFIPISDHVNFNVYYKTEDDGHSVNNILIDYDVNSFKPDTLYKIKLLNGEVHGFIYRQGDHVVDHYLLS